MSSRSRVLAWVVSALVLALLAAALIIVARREGRPNEPSAEVERRRATAALIAPVDIGQSTVGSVVEIEYSTYGKCFGDKPLLDLAGTGRTAAAQSPGVELDDRAYVGSAVVLAKRAESTISTFVALTDSAVLSCINEAFQRIVEERTERFVQQISIEVVREPPVGDQSIGYAIDFGALFPINDAHLGVTVVRAGRGLGFLFTAVGGPQRFPDAERVRLASLMAARMPR
ncbi:MAG: hypothetical protein ACRD12_12205 [Acidimicrobiales bacterium]